MLGTILNDAFGRRLIAANPAAGVTKPKPVAKEKTTLDEEQAKRLLVHALPEGQRCTPGTPDGKPKCFRDKDLRQWALLDSNQ